MAEEPQAAPGTDPGAAAVDGDPADEQELDELGTEEGGEEEWTPPTREEWEAHQAKLKRANEQAKRLREKSRTAPTPAPEPPAGADPAEIAVWQARAVRTAAKAELLTRGADPDMVDLALGRLQPAEIEFNRDDEPDLEDWLDEMEERYPKLFAKAAPAPAAPRTGRVDQGRAAARPPARKLSLGEQIIAQSEAARVRAARPGRP